jgi:hypothetical protein
MADENDVTEQHVAAVIERLRAGITRWNGLAFNMSFWTDRNTAGHTPACVWGAAYFEACGEFPDRPPTEDWITTEYREGLYWIFMQGHLEPSKVVLLYDKLNTDGKWRGLTLADCTCVLDTGKSIYSLPKNVAKSAPDTWGAIHEELKKKKLRRHYNPKSVFKL